MLCLQFIRLCVWWLAAVQHRLVGWMWVLLWAAGEERLGRHLDVQMDRWTVLSVPDSQIAVAAWGGKSRLILMGRDTPETVTGCHYQQFQPDPLHQVMVTLRQQYQVTISGSNILLLKQWLLPENYTLPPPGKRCWLCWMEMLKKPGFSVLSVVPIVLSYDGIELKGSGRSV